MSEYRPVILDCKVKVRKYVLVSQPSRWKQRGDRVVVQSSMLTIPNNVTHVPVKRYNGEEQNSVCSLPREDIEKDSSSVYEKSQVATTVSWVDAHGVALVDNSISDEFKYRRNDKFWICIGSKTNDYTATVPVINLRTSESGVISIDHVCWYPKIRGPDNELWTPGGIVWALKLCGPKKFTYFSWVICQRLPTATVTSIEDLATTTKSPQVPTRDVQVKDTTLLSVTESRELFEKRLRFMDISGRFRCIPSPEAFLSPSNTPSVSTLPWSPSLDQPWRQKERENGRLNTLTGMQQDGSDQGLWGRILAMVPKSEKETGYILKNSPIHPQELLKTQPKASQRQSSIESCPSLQDCESVDDDPSECVTVTGSGSSTPRNSYSSGPITPDIKDLAAADILLDIFHDKTTRSAISVTSPSISSNTNSIYDAWQRNKPRYNPLLEGLCDQGDAKCQYNTMFPCKHYHSPPAKCLIVNPELKPASPYSSSHHPPRSTKPHECCISRLSPFPSGAGSCMLSSLPSRNHICCCWAASELDGMPILHKREYDKVSIEFHVSKRMRILDRRGLVDGCLGLELGIGLGVGLVGSEEMGREGRKLQRDLDEGVLRVDGTFEIMAERSPEGDALCEELGILPLSLTLPPREEIRSNGVQHAVES